jgi:polyisoprenoid-binding protein YceI
MKSAHFAVAMALLFAASPAAASHWTVDYTKSHLGFAVTWDREPFSAEFKHWNVDIDFDPGDLVHAHASVDIDLGSESSDEPDFDSGLKGAEGFEISRFPTARFVTRTFSRRGGDTYVADGTLTIRGISRDISLPFKLALSGRTAHMTGTAHVLRSDFGVGQGTAAAPVSRDVTVSIDLTASK